MIRFFDTVDHALGVDGGKLFNREIVFLGNHVEDIEGDRDVEMVAVVAVVAADTVDFDVDLDLTEIVVQRIHEGLGSFPGDVVVDIANAKGNKEEKERALLWLTTFGIQSVVNLKPSEDFFAIIKRHIEGECDINQIHLDTR